MYVFPIERTSQKAIIGSAVIFSLLPVIAVVLRIVARSRLKQFSLDLSDWLIILACVSFLSARVVLYLYRNCLLTKYNALDRSSRVSSTCSRLRCGGGDGIPHERSPCDGRTGVVHPSHEACNRGRGLLVAQSRVNENVHSRLVHQDLLH